MEISESEHMQIVFDCVIGETAILKRYVLIVILDTPDSKTKCYLIVILDSIDSETNLSLTGADFETSFVLGLCLSDCDHDIDSATGTVFLIVISKLILKPVFPFAFGNEIEG